MCPRCAWFVQGEISTVGRRVILKKCEPTGYGSARKERQTYGEEVAAYLWISQGHSDSFLFDFKKSRSRRGEEFGSCASGLLANAFRSMPKNSLTASNSVGSALSPIAIRAQLCAGFLSRCPSQYNASTARVPLDDFHDRVRAEPEIAGNQPVGQPLGM